MSDRTGVIPEPAAMATARLGFVGSRSIVNSPTGGITSSTSPAESSVVAYVLKSPPASRLIPTLSFPEAELAHIE